MVSTVESLQGMNFPSMQLPFSILSIIEAYFDIDCP